MDSIMLDIQRKTASAWTLLDFLGTVVGGGATPNVCGSSPNARQPLRIAAKTYEPPYLATILSGNIIAGRVLANAGSIADLGI